MDVGELSSIEEIKQLKAVVPGRRLKSKGATLTIPDKAKFIALIAPVQDEVANELKTADLLQIARSHAK
jgi:hypothetical protein